MTGQLLFVLSLFVLAVTAADDLHFTLTTADGNVVTGGESDLNSRLLVHYSQIAINPEKSQQLDEFKKLNDAKLKAIEDNAKAGTLSREDANQQATDATYDLYEKIFEINGEKLVVDKRPVLGR